MKAGSVCMFTTEVMVPGSRKLLSKYLGKEKKKEGRDEGIKVGM